MRARRPGMARWLWYAVGGRLPASYREWVLFDLTARTWVLRHLSRAVLQLSVWWVLLLVPGPITLRLSMVAAAYGVGLYFSLAFMEDASERRLIKHGFPVGLNRRIREEADQTADRAELAAMYTAWYTDDGDESA